MIMWFLYVTGIITIYPVWLLFFKLKTYYVDRRVQSRRIKGGAIIISNHKSFKDFMMYLCAFPFRKIYCLMSEKVYGINKMVSYLSTVLGGIRVDRRDFNFKFIEKSVELLNKNKLLMVFPEGKMPTTKIMGPFYPSYIMIALKANKPIIPIYTPGRYGFFKRGRMVVGKPIYIKDLIKSDVPSKEEIDKANKFIRNEVLKLQDLCNKKMLCEKYHKKFSFRYFFHDLGRLHIFFIDLIVLRFKRYNLGEKKYKQKFKNNLIITSNHLSFSDPLIIMGTYLRRRMHMLVSEVVYDNHPIRSKALNGLGCIRIDRDNYDADAVEKCEDILNGNGLISLFPEGHISRDGLSEFKHGAAYLSLKCNTCILPMYIKYKDRGFYRFNVYYGDIIDPNDFKDIVKKSDKIIAMTNKLYEETKRLEMIANGSLEL